MTAASIIAGVGLLLAVGFLVREYRKVGRS